MTEGSVPSDLLHPHTWVYDNEAAIVDTMPPLSTWYCVCGAETHDPKTGILCSIKHYTTRDRRGGGKLSW